jgi:uncharacterized protein
MRDQIEKLCELFKLDDQIKALTGRIRNREMELKRNVMEENLLTDSFTREKENLSATEKRHRDTNREIEMLEERKGKLKINLSNVRENNEYQALLREIATIEAKITEHMGKAIQCMDDEEGGHTKIDKMTGDVANKQKKLETIRKTLESEKQQLGQEISQLTAERTELAGTLKMAVKSKYERVLKAKGDSAIVSVEDGACSGCHFRLPPQMVAEVRGGDRLVFCESCNRILVMMALHE